MQKEACGCAQHARDGGVLPTTGFPRVSGMETSDNSDTVQTRASHTTCMHSFTGVVSGLYLRSVHFGTDQVRYDVEEVVVHGSSWEVVVHVS